MAETSSQSWLGARIDTSPSGGEWTMWKIAVAVLAIELPPIGLASSAVGDFHDRGTVADNRNPMMIIVVTVASFAEVCWLVCASCLLVACGFHFVFFLSVAVITVLSFGSGVFALVAMGMSFASSVCDSDLSPGQCEVGLRKGLAAGILKLIFTTTAYAYVAYWYFWGPGGRQKRAIRRQQQQQQREEQGHDGIPLVDVTK